MPPGEKEGAWFQWSRARRRAAQQVWMRKVWRQLPLSRTESPPCHTWRRLRLTLHPKAEVAAARWKAAVVSVCRVAMLGPGSMCAPVEVCRVGATPYAKAAICHHKALTSASQPHLYPSFPPSLPCPAQAHAHCNHTCPPAQACATCHDRYFIIGRVRLRYLHCILTLIPHSRHRIHAHCQHMRPSLQAGQATAAGQRVRQVAAPAAGATAVMSALSRASSPTMRHPLRSRGRRHRAYTHRARPRRPSKQWRR